jgi:type VI secretion system protein ImpA
MAIKVEELLQPVLPDDPAGPSLEYDPAYLGLLKAAEGVPEQQVGAEVIPAVEPDWQAVRTSSDDLLKKSKDLRVAVFLDSALLRMEGLPGMRDGLKLLKGLVELYWDVLHPKLDPDDNNDPTQRLNILRVFGSSDANADGRQSPMIEALREAPLASSRQVGRFGLKQIAIATGELTVELKPGEVRPEMGVIDAAARDMDPAVLQTARDAAVEAVTLTKELEALVDGHVGNGRGVDFKDFVRNLQATIKYLDRFLQLHGIGNGAADESAEGRSDTGGGGGSPVTGDIRSTNDVVRLLEKICDFYDRVEPSSPIPLLLRRAQRLVGKDFWQVLQELSPEAINAVKIISGADPKAPETPT